MPGSRTLPASEDLPRQHCGRPTCLSTGCRPRSTDPSYQACCGGLWSPPRRGIASARTGLLRRAALALWSAHGIRRCRCRTNSRTRRGAAGVGVVARSRDVAGAQHLCLMRRAPRGCLPPVLGVLAGGFGPSLPDRTLLDEVSVIYVLHRDRRHINPLGHCSTELIRGSSADGNVDPNRGSGSCPKGAQRSFDPHGTLADSVRHL